MSEQKEVDNPNVSDIAIDNEVSEYKSNIDSNNDNDDGDDRVCDIIEMNNRINPNKWMGLFRGYIRSDLYLDELRASWVELFYDLIFVACIVHLAYEGVHSLPIKTSDDEEIHRRLASVDSGDCYEYGFLFTVFAQFGLFSTFWMEQVMYITHFEFNQICDEIIRVIYMTFVLSMGVFVSNNKNYHIAFLISYCLLRFISLFMYLKAAMIPRAKWHAIWHIILYFIILIITIYIVLAIAYSIIDGYCSIPYFIIYSILFCFEYFGRITRLIFVDSLSSIKISMNIPHIAERFGLFVMIILGESLISVMTADIGNLDLTMNWNNGLPDIAKIIFILLTFILSYLIARLYYNSQPSEEQIMRNEENHALGRKHKIYGKLYQFVHQILFFALFGYGVGIKIAAQHLLEFDLNHNKYFIDVLLPGYSIVIIVICLNIIRIAHPFDKSEYATYKNIWCLRILIIIIMAVVLIGGQTIHRGVLFAIIFTCIVMLAIIDIEGESNIKREKIEAKEKRESFSVQENVNHDDGDIIDNNLLIQI